MMNEEQDCGVRPPGQYKLGEITCNDCENCGEFINDSDYPTITDAHLCSKRFGTQYGIKVAFICAYFEAKK